MIELTTSFPIIIINLVKNIYYWCHFLAS